MSIEKVLVQKEHPACTRQIRLPLPSSDGLLSVLTAQGSGVSLSSLGHRRTG